SDAGPTGTAAAPCAVRVSPDGPFFGVFLIRATDVERTVTLIQVAQAFLLTGQRHACRDILPGLPSIRAPINPAALARHRTDELRPGLSKGGRCTAALADADIDEVGGCAGRISVRDRAPVQPAVDASEQAELAGAQVQNLTVVRVDRQALR